MHQAVAADILHLHPQDGKDVKLSKYQGLFGKPVVRCHTASTRMSALTRTMFVGNTVSDPKRFMILRAGAVLLPVRRLAR